MPANEGSSNNSGPAYSIPQETLKLFQSGILENPLIAPNLPEGIEECAKLVEFKGSDQASIPINWRFAESISALKGLEAATINVLLRRKYQVEPQRAVINTDHAQLFIMSPMLWTIDPDGEAVKQTDVNSDKYHQYFKNTNLHDMGTSHYRTSATNIYRCKDGRYFHLHGSMNADPTIKSVGLPTEPSTQYATPEESYQPFIEAVGKLNSDEMQHLATDVYKQAGTICWTPSEYQSSAHGQANAHINLFEIHRVQNHSQAPSWWPSTPQTSPQRPLAGLKVLDITRVIAAPAVTRGLAELGASVMRITAPHITDMSTLHCDMNWGKWNCHLDFRSAEDREKLRELVRDTDVVVQGYRPGVLDKYGLSPQELFDLCKDRDRGLIVARENCYGWNGEWKDRTGWQQISDASSGVSMEFGRAMGLDEPVTPVFPNSDFCTGVCGVVGILNAVMKRGEEGGSYLVDIALNYYSQWLVSTAGTYPRPVWDELWSRNGRQVFRHYHNMQYTIPRYFQMLHENSEATLFNPDFFEDRFSGAIGKAVRTIKSVIQFPDGLVQLRFNIGTRGNGVDKAEWPVDLQTEVVA